ncbi:MAG TPA: hypothetical protein VLS90_11095, partial [Thermodesulfobacteriota bacterium]|nr:hypothetical protein [Thermodesulfobacteriota bacterium]
EVWRNPGKFGVKLIPDPTQDLSASVEYITAEGINTARAEKLKGEMNEKLGLPKYFWRHVATMLDHFYP